MLEVPVDLRPQVEHDALAGVLQHVGLHELQDEGAQQDPEEQQRDSVHPGHVARRDVPVNRHFIR